MCYNILQILGNTTADYQKQNTKRKLDSRYLLTDDNNHCYSGTIIGIPINTNSKVLLISAANGLINK
jgi:hypothetical protein